MSLFGKLSKLWKGFSTRRRNDQARRRRLFMESLEGRQLMAVDLFVEKSGDGSVLAGELLTYNITVTNNGDDDATDVVLTDVLPEHTNFSALSGPDTDEDDSPIIKDVPGANLPGTVTVTIPRLPGFTSELLGQSRSMSFTLLLNVNTNAAELVGLLSNTASAVSDFDEFAFGTDFDNTSPAVETTVGSSADLAIMKQAPAGTIMAGNDVTFTITVDNGGPSNSQDVVVTDVLPTGLFFKSVDLTGAAGWTRTDTTPIGSNGIITFSKTSMDSPNTVPNNSGAVAVILITATVDPNVTSGQLSNPVTVVSNGTIDPFEPNNEDEATITVQGTPKPDVVVSKVVTGGTTSVVAGTELSYTITVTNSGDAAATALTLRDVLPTNTTYVSFSVPNGSDWILQQEPVGDAGTVVATSAAGLAPSASAVFTFIVRVNTSATGNIQNQAAVDPVTNEGNTGNNSSALVVTPTLREAALTITKTDDPDATTSRPGDPIRYTVTVTNPLVANGGGPSDVTGVTISDLFDTTKLTNIRYTSVASGGASGNSQNPNPGSPISSINDVNVSLPLGSSITYTIDADILSSATGDLSNLASIVVPVGTTNTGTASDDDVNTLVVEADLLVTKSTVSTFIQPGDLLTYTITVQNVGASDAINPTLTDMVPAGTTFESFTAPAEWTELAALPNVGEGGTIQFGTGVLAADATATFTLVVRVDAGTIGTTITNQADATSDTPEPSPDGNPNSDFVNTPVTGPPVPDLIVTKTDSPDPVIAGQTGQGTTTGFITYTIRVTNQGNGPANQVVLTDVMPTASTGAAPTFVSFVAPAGWSINTVPTVGSSTGTIQVTSNNNATDNLDSLEFAEFTLVVRVPPNATNGAIVTNTATVAVAAGSFTPETDTSNNSSGPTTTTVNTSANLSINKTAVTPNTVVVGSLISYTITVSSVGPSNASSVTITDLIPAGTTFQSMTANTGTTGWTIEPPNAIHPNSVIATNATLAPGASGSFTLTVRTNSNLNDGFVVSNFATIGSATTDPVPANNTSPTISTTVRVPLDFGDAPNSYGTLLASNGPRHAQSLASTLRLGATVDNELDGQPNPAGLGDDQNGTSVDDEDGVILPTSLIVGRSGAAIVNVVGEGFLNAWIDFNGDGDFLDDGEQVAFDQAVFDGPNPVAFAVPAGAITGSTFARFRLNSTGSLAPTGPAADGEVEDYGVSIITVTPGTTEILPDPENPGFNMLSINGTAKADTVAVKQLRTHLLQVQVTFNRKLSPKYSMADFRRVVFYGGEGNDTFSMGLARPTSLHGEGGNDRLTGGGGYDEIFGDQGNDTLNGANGNDILVGGEGVDNLSGGGGRDILIGGLGGDTLNGGADDDILVGGTTDYDTNQAALAAVLAEWSTRDTFANRSNKLSALVGSSLHDDFAKDKFTGGTGSDWHLNFLLDTISGFSSKADKKRL